MTHPGSAGSHPAPTGRKALKINWGWVAIGLVAAFLLIVGAGWLVGKLNRSSNDSAKAVATVAPVVQKSVGLVFTGCGETIAILENTNPCAIRVRKIHWFNGEVTQWMKEIGPGATLSVGDARQNGFYIYNTAGGLLWYFSGDCPQPPPEKPKK